MDVIPTADGIARVSTAAISRSPDSRARAPTKRSSVATASIRAMSSASPSISTWMTLTCGATSHSATDPEATSAAAAPAAEPSCMPGNTLLVPVEMGTSGASSQPFASARLVPSPPSEMTAPQDARCIAAAARTVSWALPWRGPATGVPATPAVITALRAMARRSSRYRTDGLGSAAAIPARQRATTARFSWLLNTDAPAATRRMSLPESGFAARPTRQVMRATSKPEQFGCRGNYLVGVGDEALFQ